MIEKKDQEKLDLNREAIGEGDLEEILENSPNVKEMDISETPIEDLTFLEQFKLDSLTYLNISSTNIGDLSPLSGLKNLKILRANQLEIKSLEFIRDLEDLEALSLEYTNIDNISPISSLKKLKYLSLTGNAKIVDISPLSELTKLEQLYLQGTGIYTRDQISKIGHMSFKSLLVNESLFSQAEILQMSSNTDSKKTFVLQKDTTSFFGSNKKERAITKKVPLISKDTHGEVAGLEFFHEELKRLMEDQRVHSIISKNPGAIANLFLQTLKEVENQSQLQSSPEIGIV